MPKKVSSQKLIISYPFDSDALDGFDEDFRGAVNKFAGGLKGEVRASVANEVGRLNKEFSALKVKLIDAIERSVGSSPDIIFDFKMDDVLKVLTSKSYYSEWFVVRNVKWRISATVDKSNLTATLSVNKSDVNYVSYNAQVAFNLVNQAQGSDYLGTSTYHNFFKVENEWSLTSPAVTIPVGVFDQSSKGFLNDDGSIILQLVVKVDPPTDAP